MYRAIRHILQEERKALQLSAFIFFCFFLLAIKTDFLIVSAVFAGLLVVAAGSYVIVKHPGYGVAIMIIGTSLDVLGRIPGTPITVFHLGVFITLLIWLLRIYLSESREVLHTTFDLPLWLFLGFISFTLIYTPEPLDAAVYFMRLIALVVVMYMTINVVTDKASLNVSIAAVILSAFVLSAVAITDITNTSAYLMQAAVGFSKVFGRFGVTFENPNYFATFLMLALAISASLIINGRLSGFMRLLLLAMAAVIMVGLVGTFSRAAWVALLPALFIVIYFSKYRAAIFISILVLTLTAVIILWNTPFVKSVIMRFSSLATASADPSSMTRVFLFQGGWDMLLDTYFMGVGYRAFPVYYEKIYRPHSQVLFDVFESHTLPMEILAELGVIGFTLFIYFMIRYFRYGLGSVNKMDHPYFRACQIGVVASMAGYLTNALFSPGQLASNYLWIGFGLTYAIPRLAAMETGKD